MLGISIKPTIGIGDGLQFSSLPENYFRETGKKLIDVSKPWFFDHNPYVDRDSTPTTTLEMWNFGLHKKYHWPQPRRDKARVYLSNAEIWARVLGVPTTLNRPRLYRFEDFPFQSRHFILLHVDGVSHGQMPEHVIEHVIGKYKETGMLFQVGQSNRDFGIPKIETQTLWDLARVISESRMFIGMDSGPSWIAACYPDVILKVLRAKPSLETLRDWVPLEIANIHSHWDDRLRQVFNVSEEDVGFTSTYRKI